ncbi:hypothetical protein COV56_03700 [Candidatus Kuenenbacteria bacterium CG11_big_fil_rev_8_21_14_0_20_37_9]|nr:MAG: hypothetical protein COV56_03700 [Candidatus Kuenenbacteria bacterium CG11_big_fil_rev_8_21_14_0_20_37_9]
MFVNFNILYILFFATSFVLSVFLTPKIRQFALKNNIIDQPELNVGRKIQEKPIPLLGGLAVYLSFLTTLLVAWGFGFLTDGRITANQILAIIFGGLAIILIGFLDDKYNIHTKSFFGPLLAGTLAVALGIAIKYVTNPFISGTGPYGRALFYFSDWLGPVFSFFWLLGMMYTTKFLDGLDGLVSGIGAIGAVILFIVSLFWDVAQSGTSIMCLILTGSLLGFLRYNWHPAKIFLGESGSVFIGFMLGVLSIISGGKIATALLIMGIPILDVVWVIFRRVFKEKKSPFAGDNKHLHFRLLKAGFSHRSAVLFLYFLTLVFGSSSLFLQSKNKVIALAFLIVVMLTLAAALVFSYKKTNRENLHG